MPRREVVQHFRATSSRNILTLVFCWFAYAPTLFAGGPRWVTGPPFFTVSGTPVVWYTNQPLYFTDPGDLSATVNHTSADALVAAAASVWNVPTDTLSLSQGGALDEHVSGANTFLGSSGLIFPTDIQTGNYLSKQIAVIYDSDGSVTDLLLGNGASDPTSCLQNGVTESVDSIVPSGFIQHAILVLNGRCTGSDPNQQLQLQYQLMRAFGRILGLGWSQTNDNVFTDSPQPTYDQAMNWPVMHPIDIICGPYTYLCMPQPFTLRPDDLSALAQLYYIAQGQASAGKTDTLLNANQITGNLVFPTGQGMQGVNILARRWQQYTDVSEQEGWFTASAVSGALFRQTNGNPVSGPDTTFAGSQGGEGQNLEGYYDIERIPMLPGDWQFVILETEPINPLYTGSYAVGPYIANTVDPSGTDTPTTYGLFSSYTQVNQLNFSPTDPANTCSTSTDGIEAEPAPIAGSGWWSDLLCGYGHAAWSSLSIKGNRSLTVEVTAEDEKGYASTAKAMPVIGIWNASDSLGSLPGLASSAQAFNGETTGTTTLSASSTLPNQLRISIADQRGDGRPDFNYQARILYADSLAPAMLTATGGIVTITGMGFRTGNTVTVNGLPATVISWTANTIIATAPSLYALGSTRALIADVTVTDLSTGGTTTMKHSLSYAAPVASLNLLTAPSGTVITAVPATTPFAVQVLAADGVTPVAGEAATFSALTGTVLFAACGSPTCTLQTNSQGVASTSVTAINPGGVTLQATGIDGTVTASFNATVLIRSITAAQTDEYIAAGAVVAWPTQVTVADNASSSTAGLLVDWQPISGPITASPSESTVDSQGSAQTLVTVGPLAKGGTAQLSACVFTTLCATFTAHFVDPSTLDVIAVSGATQNVPSTGMLAPVVLRVVDPASHPVAGAVVQIDQTVQAWQPPCPSRGRCPIPPVYASSQQQLTTDWNGVLTVVPLQVPDVAGTTNLAAAVGANGFISLALQTQP
jgi:IPT/TIG domain